MAKVFNVSGACRPNRHYMVNLEPRLKEIKAMVDEGVYFAINKARQYGKTTILRALAEFLKKDYLVVSLDFQRLGSLSVESEQSFVAAFSEELLYSVESFFGQLIWIATGLRLSSRWYLRGYMISVI